VAFVDEAQFARGEIQNFHNQHLWTDENPHAIPSHITNSGSSISGPVFVVKIYSEPTYFQTSLQRANAKLA
jgi:hypothetical protein